MTLLCPMTAAEFDEYKQLSVTEYAKQKVKSGDWSKVEAIQKSHLEFNHALPEGINTNNHFLFTITDENKQNIGILWYAIEPRAGLKTVYIYDISINPQHRRKGHAKRTLLALESKTKAMGIKSIGLNVFGFNTQAYRLYEKLGFQPASIKMYKSID